MKFNCNLILAAVFAAQATLSLTAMGQCDLLDSDGDGFSDVQEQAVGTSIYDSALAPLWVETFDCYETGSSMHGQGGWRGWGNNVSAQGFVTDEYSLSPSHSLEMSPGVDLVYEFSGVNFGQWTLVTKQFVPDDFTGYGFLILLNTYSDNGPFNWSTQLRIGDGVIHAYGGETLPLITGQWVDLRIEIDFDTDSQSIYYNNQLLVTKSWTNGVSTGGALNLAVVDLFITNGSLFYYDDVSLVPTDNLTDNDNTNPFCSADVTDAQASFNEPAPGSFVVTAGETITVPFTGTDLDGDNLTVTSTGLPAGATLSPTSGSALLVSTFEWTPNAADKGGVPYTVQVTFEDPFNGTSTCNVTIADINLKPSCNAGADLNLECDAPDGAMVTLYGSATDADDATLSYHWSVSDLDVTLNDADTQSPTAVFPVGITMATLTVTDGRGGVCVDDVVITIQDTTPPEVMVTTDCAALWPPKHDMREVTIIIFATDTCEDPENVIPLIVTVSSNEPDNANGNGDGNTIGDVGGQDGHAGYVDVTSSFAYDVDLGAWIGTIQLRAERDGDGNGRAYTIDVSAWDTYNNIATTSCVVVVPHDKRGN